MQHILLNFNSEKNQLPSLKLPKQACDLTLLLFMEFYLQWCEMPIFLSVISQPQKTICCHGLRNPCSRIKRIGIEMWNRKEMRMDFTERHFQLFFSK